MTDQNTGSPTDDDNDDRTFLEKVVQSRSDEADRAGGGAPTGTGEPGGAGGAGGVVKNQERDSQ